MYLCSMIAIDNVLISDQVVEEQFVCDLNKCKGGCCVDGDAGAPLDKKELKELDEVYDAVLPYLNGRSKKRIGEAREDMCMIKNLAGLHQQLIQAFVCMELLMKMEL